MKNETVFSKKFSAFFKRLKKAKSVELPPKLDSIHQLVIGFLQWESTTKSAKAAYSRLMAELVDYNDLRVSYSFEIVAMIGLNYSKAEDRTGRLLAVLQEIYIREHAVSLDSLANKPKKEVRAYLETLPEMPPYVAAQVTLLCFGGHAVPVDEVLVKKLQGEGVVDPEASVEQVGSFLERQIRASDAVESHAVLRGWVDDRSKRSASSAKTVATTTKKKALSKTPKSTKKKTTKRPTKK